MQIMSEDLTGADPETQARIDQILWQIFETVEENKRTLDAELLRLLGLMSVEFNIVERDFKYLLILLQDDQPLFEARKFALSHKRFVDLLRVVKERFKAKFSDPTLIRDFEQIIQEADALRKERNLMLHSIWLPTSDPENPFVRMKEDERDPEIDFDVQTVKKLVDSMIECRNRAYDFFCEAISGYAQLPARLYDSTRPGSQLRVKDIVERELERDDQTPN